MLVQCAPEETNPISLVYGLHLVPWGVRRGSEDSWVSCHVMEESKVRARLLVCAGSLGTFREHLCRGLPFAE